MIETLKCTCRGTWTGCQPERLHRYSNHGFGRGSGVLFRGWEWLFFRKGGIDTSVRVRFGDAGYNVGRVAEAEAFMRGELNVFLSEVVSLCCFLMVVNIEKKHTKRHACIC